MVLGSTQSLTEMSIRNFSGGRGPPARMADVTAICESIVENMWARTTENTAFNSSSVVARRFVAVGTCLRLLPSNESTRYNIMKKVRSVMKI
jgi:hypothetical protein